MAPSAQAEKPETGSTITIVIVDDHLLIRESLKAMLASRAGIQVVGEAGDGRQSLLLIERLQPTVAILDISMPGPGGLDLAPRIREIAPATEILILSMHHNPNYVFLAFKAGCRGYLLKSDSSEEMEKAIRKVAKGQTYLSPGIATDFIDHLVTRSESNDAPGSLLTTREQELCRLLAQGRATEQLAADLFISPKTVRVHVANIMKKLSCRSRTELILKLREMEKL